MKKIVAIISFFVVYTYGNTFNIGKNKIKAGGQIVADTAWIDDNGYRYHKSEIRRARIYLKGDLTKFLSYELEYSFTGKNDWRDVYLKYTGFSGWMIYIGNIKEAFGLEALTSSKYNTFMERALSDLYNSRKMGILVKGHKKIDTNILTYAAGGYGKSLDEAIDNKHGNNSLTTRLTYAKIFSKKMIYHLGISTSFTDHDQDSIKLTSDIGSHLYLGSFLKTKVKKVDHTKRIGLEAAVVYNALSFQGEYILYTISNTINSYNFSGWYIQASWFLTGESKKYKIKSATFSRTKPYKPINQGGYGAVEVALRLTQLDINDKDENGKEERDIAFGINWYLKPNLRLMSEYTFADEILENSKDAKLFQLRVLYDF